MSYHRRLYNRSFSPNTAKSLNDKLTMSETKVVLEQNPNYSE